MRELGDIAEDAVLDFTFTTAKAGVPFTLAGTPAVSVYKGNGTTETAAGVTLTTDFDARTGLNHVRIDTSADAFYVTAADYNVVITAGTVDGNSVVGYTLGRFSIQNRYDAAAAALDTAIPGTPTADSINERLVTLDDAYTATRAGYLDELNAPNLPADIDQLKADLPNRITKNVAFSNFPFLMVDSTDHATPKTGLTITATRRIDGGAFAACANAATEVANGIYTINLAASDVNGDVVTFRFTAATADDRFITVLTQPT